MVSVYRKEKKEGMSRVLVGFWAGVTVEEFCERIGCGFVFVENLENGVDEWSPDIGFAGCCVDRLSIGNTFCHHAEIGDDVIKLTTFSKSFTYAIVAGVR